MVAVGRHTGNTVLRVYRAKRQRHLFHGRTRPAYLYRCVSIWYNGPITPRVHSGRNQTNSVGYTTVRPRPWNKCVKQLSGVGHVSVKRTYPTPDSCLTYVKPV